MSTELVKQETRTEQEFSFSKSQRDIIKNTYCKNCTDDEVSVFVHICERIRLDPMLRQIHPVVRESNVKEGNNWVKVRTLTPQTSIDGFRLIAERTRRYVPGDEPTFQYDKEGNLVSSTAYVKKLAHDGSWHVIGARAFYAEYVQGFKNKQTGVMEVGKFWKQMPHLMLAKCAEALALRKSFPAELSGVYTDDEMKQADPVDLQDASVSQPVLTAKSANSANLQIDMSPKTEVTGLLSKLQKGQELTDKLLMKCNVKSIDQIPDDKLKLCVDWLEGLLKTQNAQVA